MQEITTADAPKQVSEPRPELERLLEEWGALVQTDTSWDGFHTDLTNKPRKFYTDIRDRMDGRHLPVYEHERDLKLIRSMCRLCYEEVPMAQSYVEALVNYTISKGFDWKVEHYSPNAQRLCESILKSWATSSKWSEQLERESFVAECVDGEWLSETIVEGPDVSIETRQPDGLTECLNVREIEDWLEIDIPVSWRFGVCWQVGRTRPLFYHIWRDTLGADWDCLRPDRFQHWTRNVPSTAKRGIGDFYVLQRYLGRADKLVDRTAVGAITQASIAYIVEHAENATKTGVDRVIAGLQNVSTKTNGYTGQSYKSVNVGPSTRLDVPNGQRYHAGLLGSNNSDIYIKVFESLLRVMAARKHMPEHFITGFAGNNNMASSLVAESPFVQGRMAEQAVRKYRFERMLLNVLKAVFNGEWARSRGLPEWSQIKQGLKIHCVEPAIVSRDPLALTNALAAQKAQGWVSDRTASTQLGYDYETEQAQRADEAAGRGSESADAQRSNHFGSMNMRQLQRIRKSIPSVLGDFASGTVSRTAAEAILRGMGLSDAELGSMLDEAATNAGTAETRVAERLSEAMRPKRRRSHCKRPAGRKRESIDDVISDGLTDYP